MTGEWPVDRTCLPDLPDEADPGYTAAKAAQDGAVALAVQVLWALSGRQYGLRDILARPCVTNIDNTLNGYPCHPSAGTVLTSYVLSWEGEGWVDWPCGCTGMCRLSGPRAVHLPGPVTEIVDVTVAGVSLAASAYTLDGGVLYRTDNAVWPVQDLGRPLGEEGTWSVEYLQGQTVPAGVDRLTGLLAKEFLAACSTDGRCRLPRTVTSVSRQGLTYTVFNPSQIYDTGKTGLPEVDSWLAAINPYHLLASPSVI